MKIIQSNIQKQAARTRGLTLIELVVVLAVLVALVGMVLAFFPDIVRKASASTSASTAKDIGRVLQTQFVTQQTYGNRYDLLATAPNTLHPSLVNISIANEGMTVAQNEAFTGDAAALNNVGITEVFQLTGTGTNTFPNQAGSITRAVAPVAVNATALFARFNFDSVTVTNFSPNATAFNDRAYYVFGLGPQCTAVGPGGFQDAPVRAGEVAIDNPTQRYGHYGVIFETRPGINAGTREAFLLGVVAFTYQGVRPASESLQSYYR